LITIALCAIYKINEVVQNKGIVRLAKRQGIEDAGLREAIRRAASGLIDAQIGRFLIKQRVARRNEGRSGGFRTIVFYREQDRAVFLHLFAKNDKGNLTSTELETYREFAKVLAGLTAEQIRTLVEQKRWIEIEP
jgi:hypothetical protein